MSEPWTIRPYDPAIDVNGVIFLWLKSFAHSSFGRARGAHVDGSDEERAYWAEHRLVVMRLLADAETTIVCDPEAPEVIWSFLCAKGPLVHYAVVKRRFREQSAEMFAALLGDRLSQPCVYTHCLQGTGLQVPKSWWLNAYRVLP